ncbi:MAG: NnrS family protein [Mariprofundus sp.]|nr:NnrS family protein [Mariprofundus sp.]
MHTNVEHTPSMSVGGVLFSSGFRIFFIAATVFAILSMLIWMGQLVFSLALLPEHLSASSWHAHEMIYGYGLAVIAGFLLTAVRNWTGIPTLHGTPLQALVLLWVVARLAPFVPLSLLPVEQAMLLGAVCDGLFIIALSIALTVPVVQARLWKNMGVVSKLYFFLPGHVLYSLDQFGLFADGRRIGLYIGLYMILSLLLLLSRRVIPMFIQRGIGGDIILRNDFRVDMACFLVFLMFAISDIFFVAPVLTAWLAGGLAVLHAVRLSGWYHRGLWQKPLLWVLYLAYGWMVIGFALKWAVLLFGVSPFLATHAFAVGGIGMMTLGMMARISLGHTGRNIMQPPAGLGWMCALFMSAVFVRVLLPLVFINNDVVLMAVSQVLWIVSFMLFLYHYILMLLQPRIDGKPG